MFTRLKARLLTNPTGVIGRYLLGPMWNRRNAALNDAAFNALGVSSGERILEVGFGGGYLLERILDAADALNVTGVDASPSLVYGAQKRFSNRKAENRPVLHNSSAESLPLPDQSVDKVVSVNSMFYWPDAAAGLAELRRVLVDGGKLVLCLTKKESLEGTGFQDHGLRLFTRDEIDSLLTAAVFCDITVNPMQDMHRRFLLFTATASA